MSYADIAARGPKQTPEEAAAPPVPEISHDSSTTSSLIDVDSPHVVSVPSDFEEQKVKTETQATRLEHEAEDKERTARKKAADMAEKAKKEASADAKKVKKEAKKAMGKLSDNRENPVVVGNAILWGITAIALGFGAYKANSEGKLDWKVAGTVAGAVGVLGVADYYGSQWLLENKYPPK